MYEYVGSKDLAAHSIGKTARVRIDCVDDVVHWIKSLGVSSVGEVVATFVIDLGGRLWIGIPARIQRHSKATHSYRLLPI